MSIRDRKRCAICLDRRPIRVGRGLAPWTEAPLWIPEEEAPHRFFLSLDCRRALADGLVFRPLSETIRDTFEWRRARANPPSLRAGMDAFREREIIESWKAQNG